jgi:hypothetical protein
MLFTLLLSLIGLSDDQNTCTTITRTARIWDAVQLRATASAAPIVYHKRDARGIGSARNFRAATGETIAERATCCVGTPNSKATTGMRPAQKEGQMMTPKLKAAAMFKVLSLAPMGQAEDRFREFAKRGDVEGFWDYYEGCLRNLPTTDERIEKAGKVSFRMMKPALEALYRLPLKTP